MGGEARFSELLTRYFGPIKPLSSGEISLLSKHYELLVRWNKALNLTSIRRLEEIVVRHYCESLFLAVHLPPEPVSVLDVGSGAGFPGIPIAVLRPDCSVVLAESHQRKAVFLRESSRDYFNVRVTASRAEDMAERFDWVVSRAVRWEEVVHVVYGHCSLLLGQGDAQKLMDLPVFRWDPPVPLPWGERRVLVCGLRI